MAKRPNIVFMIADDHRHSDIHALHHNPVQTPTFDRLAAEGTAFKNTHIMGGWHRAVCAPSRACMLTGGAVFHAVVNEPEPQFDDVMKNHCGVNQHMAIMPETFRKSGYNTFAIGKWHNDMQTFKRGFSGGDALFFGGMSEPHQIPLHTFNKEGNYPRETAVVVDEHATTRFCNAGVDFIENYHEDSPFFLYIAFTSPHDPRWAPQQYRDMYDPARIPLPRNFMGVHPFDNGEMHVRDEGLACLPRDPNEVCGHIADYYSMISHMDAEIGRVVEALHKKGIAEDTIVVYTSDHGLSVGQHGLMGKQNLYDHSIRIPLIMRGPGIGEGQVVDALSCQMDIFPTLCGLSDIEIPATTDGQSLVPLINGEKEKVYDSVFSAYKDVQRMVKKGKWKMIKYYHSEVSHSGCERVQIFNVEKDPWEINNLILDPQYAHLYEELSEEMKNWQIRVDDPMLK
jgi:arylsulfatase A-like enzyme